MPLVWAEEGDAPFLQPLASPDASFPANEGPTLEAPRGRAMGGNPVGDRGRSPFTARLFWVPPEKLKGQPGDLSVSGAEIEIAFPIFMSDEGVWLALASVQGLQINTSAVFPDSGLPVPDQLWDIEVGTMHIRDLGGGKKAGGMFRVGSPSDQPFDALRDMTVTVLGFLTIPSGERDAWSFSLFYSPTGQIVFPIPGVAYIWRPNSQFQANLGIPFSLEYRPTDTLTLTASYMPLTNFQVLLRQSWGEFWSVYGGYRTVNETFLLADRVDDQERTYFFDQRLTLGLQRELGSGWSIDVSADYVFDRQLFQAEKFSGDRRDELAMEPGVAGTLQLSWMR